MQLHVNTRNLRSSHQLIWFLLDFVMLGLLMINLTWLIADSLYAVDGVRDVIAWFLPDMVEWYRPIHRNFFFYDLAFVALFIAEFILRWAHAAYRHTYARWYFYPFIHWYDLVGCIPAGAYRFLRVLRLFSILYRLHQYQIIDFTKTRIWQFCQFYYDAFLEELSDRIVIKVLSGAQEEIRRGSPLVHQIQEQILLPRKPMLVNWISAKLTQASEQAYHPNKAALRRYLEAKVDHAVSQNPEVQRLKLVPVLGNSIQDSLEKAISDILSYIIDEILQDLGSAENHQFIEDISSVFLPENLHERDALDQEVLGALVELLELIKKQVGIKRWHQILSEKQPAKQPPPAEHPDPSVSH